MFLAPPDDAAVAYEFFAPFAHVPGRYEWCRIVSPTHGAFDTFIVLGATTGHPAHVYVADERGAAFLRERYPECTAHRVPPGDLLITESPDRRAVHGLLRATTGPVRTAALHLVAERDAAPRQVPYGGEGRPVWGSRFTCWGVDLVLDGRAHGHVETPAGVEVLRGEPCVVTWGSFGRLAPLPAERRPDVRAVPAR